MKQDTPIFAKINFYICCTCILFLIVSFLDRVRLDRIRIVWGEIGDGIEYFVNVILMLFYVFMFFSLRKKHDYKYFFISSIIIFLSLVIPIYFYINLFWI